MFQKALGDWNMKAFMKNDRGNTGSAFIKSNNGSSSVLVILIMITLVVLGLLAMMSTYSGLKLSRKNAEWTKEYYVLDAKAETLLAKIDSYLIEAETSAKAYISSKNYEKQISGLVQDDIQKAVYEGWQKAVSENGEEKYINSLYKKLYYMFSVKTLKESANNAFEVSSRIDFSNPAEVFTTDTVELDEDAVAVSAKVDEEGKEAGRSLLVGINIKCSINGSADAGERYTITSWKELPKKFEYKDSLEFENLEVE